MSPDNNLKCKYVVDLEKSCLLNNFEKRGWIPVRVERQIIQGDCNLDFTRKWRLEFLLVRCAQFEEPLRHRVNDTNE